MTLEYRLWHELKSQLNQKLTRPYFHEREIWWCSLGKIIGDEEDGKGNYLERPVLIIRKFNNRVFIALPLSSRIKPHNPYYTMIHYKGRIGSVITSQIRLLDSKRLRRKLTVLEISQFESVRTKLKSQI